MLKFEPSDSVGSVLQRYRGAGPGFDLLRMGLSCMIFVYHIWLIGGLWEQSAADTAAQRASSVHHEAAAGVPNPAQANMDSLPPVMRPLVLGFAARISPRTAQGTNQSRPNRLPIFR